jgi:hypothetical protein
LDHRQPTALEGRIDGAPVVLYLGILLSIRQHFKYGSTADPPAS